jgi:YYY domain-containing protein
LIGVTILGIVLGLLTPDARMALQSWLANEPIPGLDPNIGRFVGGRLLERLFDPWTAVWLALAMVVIVKLINHPSVLASSQSGEPLAHPSMPFILLLLFMGAGLALSVEFVFLADTFNTRMNTVFKFYYQVWALWGVAAACAIGLIVGDGKLWAPYRVVTGILAALLTLGGLVYPLTALATLGDWKHLTLDGAEWVRQSSPDDYAAIQWLTRNVQDAPVILEAPGQSYRAETSRVSAFTGLPTVLGWGGHELQWRGNYDEAGRREPDIKKLYTTRDEQETLTLLDKYAISYVYVGPVERAAYSAGLQKFDALMSVAFQQGSVTIYQRK